MDSQHCNKDNKVTRHPSLTLKDIFSESNDLIKMDSLRGSSSALANSRVAKFLTGSQSSFVRDLSRSLIVKKSLSIRGVRFSDNVQIQEIAKYSCSVLDDLFYDSNELANFRYEAFLEQCGLGPEEEVP